MNAHWPRYAAILRQRDGPEGYFQDRAQRMDQIWQLLESTLPTLAAQQRILLFDLESSHVPSSATIYARKRSLPPATAHQLVHVSIAASVANYRVGTDISYPGVIPDSLGELEQARVPVDRRPFLFSFRGVNSNAVRPPLFKVRMQPPHQPPHLLRNITRISPYLH